MNPFQGRIDAYWTDAIHAQISRSRRERLLRERLTLIEVSQLTTPVQEVREHPDALPYWGWEMEMGHCPCPSNIQRL